MHLNLGQVHEKTLNKGANAVFAVRLCSKHNKPKTNYMILNLLAVPLHSINSMCLVINALIRLLISFRRWYLCRKIFSKDFH